MHVGTRILLKMAANRFARVNPKKPKGYHNRFVASYE